MSIEKRIVQEERKVMAEIFRLCEGNLKRLAMKKSSVPTNFYNFDEMGSITNLGFDFEVLNLDQDKLILLGDHVKKLKNIVRFTIYRTKDRISFDWLKELNFIKELVIKKSFLTTIPEFIKEFNNLEELDLDYNRIATLPEWLPNLPELKLLSLSSKFPILEFTQKNIDILKALHNKNIEVSDSIFRLHIELGLPREQVKIIRDIKNEKGENIVRGVNIEDYSLNERESYLSEIEPYVVDLAVLDGKIAQLGIDDMSLKELPENFGKIDGLTKLIIKNTDLTSLPESFGDLNELTELNLSNNVIASLPESFVNLTSIRKLDLGYNQLSEIPTQLWALKELTKLHLSNNPLNDEDKNISQKVPDLIREYLRKKATIKVFISHAVIDFEPYRIGELVDYLEKQNEISQVFFCEEDLAGNIDEWMLDAVQKCQLLLFIGTNKSVFNSVDCDNELQLADKFSIPVIPLKGKDVDWPDLAERNLSRELGLEYDTENFEDFCKNLYKYVENFKREINLMEKSELRQGIIDIYERYRLML
ncbi:hypothetical protein LCGC14_2062690, partial [marine sediment metagenome]